MEKARKIALGEITPPKLRKPKKLFTKKIERNKSFSNRKSGKHASRKSTKEKTEINNNNKLDTYTSITNSEVSFAARRNSSRSGGTQQRRRNFYGETCRSMTEISSNPPHFRQSFDDLNEHEHRKVLKLFQNEFSTTI